MQINAFQRGQRELLGSADDDQFSLYGGKGQERISGGAGTDTLTLNYGGHRYALEKQGEHWVLYADDEAIRLEGIEQIRWGEQVMSLEQALGAQHGSSGDDLATLMRHHREYDGGAGTDTVLIPVPYTHEVHLEPRGEAWLLRFGERELLLQNVERLQFNNFELNLSRDGAKAVQPIQRLPFGTEGLRVIGNELGSPVAGEIGDDWLEGGGGDDSLYGSKGQDTAVYSGQRSEYEVRLDTYTGRATVRHLGEGRDGTDSLVSIERLQFADGLFDLEALAERYASQPEPGPVVDGELMPLEFYVGDGEVHVVATALTGIPDTPPDLPLNLL